MQEAFEAIALVHFEALYLTAKCLTRNADEAQDLVQETYYKAYRAFHRFTPGTSIKNWLFTILHHAYIDALRKASRQPEEGGCVWIENYGVDTALAWKELGWGAVEVTLRHAVHDEVKQALETLPEKVRQVVLLADLEEYSYQEIATMVGCPVGTVMSRLFRGRQLLRQQLEAYARACGYLKASRNEAGHLPSPDFDPVAAHCGHVGGDEA